MFDDNNNDNALRVRRSLRSGTAVAAVLFGCMSAASAGESLDDQLSGMTPVTSEELGKERGGFDIGPVKVSFGFSLSTTVSGGALGQGVTVTTNFTVSSPGNLKNLGTTISSAVQQNLQKAGVASDGNPATPSLGEKIASTVNTALSTSLPNAGPSLAPTSDTASTGAASTSASTLSAPLETSVPTPASTPSAPSPTTLTTLSPASTSTLATELPSVPAPSDIIVASTQADVPASTPVQTLTSTATPTVADAPIVTAPTVTPIVTAATAPAPALAPAVADTPIVSAAPAPNTVSDAPIDAPIGDKPRDTPAILPSQQFTAQVDQANGTVSLSAGGTNLLMRSLQGTMTLIQNSENDVQIKNNLSANYVIENYRDIALMSGMHEQLTDLARQLLALQGLGHP